MPNFKIEPLISSSLEVYKYFDLNPKDPDKRILPIAMRALVLYSPIKLIIPLQRAVIVYNPIDFRAVAAQYIKNNKALTVYNPIDFRLEVTRSITRSLIEIKLELREIEKAIPARITDDTHLLELTKTISERLSALKNRLVVTVDGFEKEFSDDVAYIQEGIACMEARFARVTKAFALVFLEEIGLQVSGPRFVTSHSLPDYLFQGAQNPLSALIEQFDQQMTGRLPRTCSGLR